MLKCLEWWLKYSWKKIMVIFWIFCQISQIILVRVLQSQAVKLETIHVLLSNTINPHFSGTFGTQEISSG